MDIIVIGAVAAGAKAASKIRRLLPDANVTIYTDDTNVSYSSCGLPYYIQGNFADYRFLLVRSVEEFNKMGIDVFLQHKVVKILLKEQLVLVQHNNDVKPVHYDKLIIATGASPIIPNIKNVDKFSNVYTVRKIEDGINIREKLLKSKKAVIIGSGYIGLELLEAFVKNGLYVYVLERNTQIISTFDEDISAVILNRLESLENKSFEIHTNETVIEFIGEDNNLTKVKTESGKVFESDMVVICSGVKPNSKIAKDAGIKIGESGAIKVNKLMQTSAANVYACGDCCEEPHIISGHSVWVPLGSTANKEGRCAAINASGGYDVFEGVLGSSVSRCLNTTMSMTGLTEREAVKFGFNPVSVIVSKSDMVSYMPESDGLTIKVVADKTTGLLLGGQAVGSIGADKRINALASALMGHLNVKDFKNSDFTYSPPFSPTIDPLLDAMNLLCKKINRPC